MYKRCILPYQNTISFNVLNVNLIINIFYEYARSNITMAVYSINIFHVLFVGPLLIAIGLYHDHPYFPQFIWQLLVILGIGIIGYHGWLAWTKYNAVNAK